MSEPGRIKKLLNDPAAAVDEFLESVLLAHPELLAGAGARAVRRAATARAGKVGIALGGGSGHEPAVEHVAGVIAVDQDYARAMGRRS
jgi:phosphoenolpyruvate---glycerone phosphotransferase subunit DhaK